MPCAHQILSLHNPHHANLDQYCASPPLSSDPRMTEVRALKMVHHPDEWGQHPIPSSVLLESEKLSWLRMVMSIWGRVRSQRESGRARQRRWMRVVMSIWGRARNQRGRGRGGRWTRTWMLMKLQHDPLPQWRWTVLPPLHHIVSQQGQSASSPSSLLSPQPPPLVPLITQPFQLLCVRNACTCSGRGPLPVLIASSSRVDAWEYQRSGGGWVVSLPLRW